MTTIVLASSSPYRKNLLHRLGIEFLTDPPAIDESPRPGESGGTLVSRLSYEKAAAVAARHRDALIIASDLIGVANGKMLVKPGAIDAAVEQLASVSGRDAQFFVGLCVLDTRDGNCQTAVERINVSFRQLSESEICDYIHREQPLDCAGSFKVEGLGIALFQRVENRDPTALEGLPLIRLCEFLKLVGCPVLGA